MSSTDTDAPVISVRDVTKSFGEVSVLRGVSFDVRRGETVCVLGGSGGGKTTLLKVMISMHAATSGSILIDGSEVVGLDERALERVRRKFGVMFQSGALLNSLTIAENVALPLEYHSDLDGETIDAMVKIKLHQVDMLHAATRFPNEISGGMQKRAAIARALALDPRILFYDEPSAGLDPIATSRIDNLINKLKESMQMTSIVITHVMESVRRIADHVVMLHQGLVILDGSLEDFEASQDARIHQFLTGDISGPDAGTLSEHDYLEDLLT